MSSSVLASPSKASPSKANHRSLKLFKKSSSHSGHPRPPLPAAPPGRSDNGDNDKDDDDDDADLPSMKAMLDTKREAKKTVSRVYSSSRSRSAATAASTARGADEDDRRRVVNVDKDSMETDDETELPSVHNILKNSQPSQATPIDPQPQQEPEPDEQQPLELEEDEFPFDEIDSIEREAVLQQSLHEPYAVTEPGTAAETDASSCVLCEVCGQDMTARTIRGREKHINECLDAQATTSAPSSSSASATGKRPCPICGKDLLSDAFTAHLKKCGKGHNVPSDKLLEIKRAQDGVLEPSSPMLPPPQPILTQKQPSSQPQRQPKQQHKAPVSSNQAQLQLAVALSASMAAPSPQLVLPADPKVLAIYGDSLPPGARVSLSRPPDRKRGESLQEARIRFFEPPPLPKKLDSVDKDVLASERAYHVMYGSQSPVKNGNGTTTSPQTPRTRRSSLQRPPTMEMSQQPSFSSQPREDEEQARPEETDIAMSQVAEEHGTRKKFSWSKLSSESSIKVTALNVKEDSEEVVRALQNARAKVLKSIKRTEIGRLLDSYKAQEEDDTTSTQWQEKEALGFLDKSFESAQKQLAGDDVYNSNPIADPSSPMEVNTNVAVSNVWTAEEIGKLIEVEREDYEKKIHNDRASIQYKIRQLQASLEEKLIRRKVAWKERASYLYQLQEKAEREAAPASPVKEVARSGFFTQQSEAESGDDEPSAASGPSTPARVDEFATPTQAATRSVSPSATHLQDTPVPLQIQSDHHPAVSSSSTKKMGTKKIEVIEIEDGDEDVSAELVYNPPGHVDDEDLMILGLKQAQPRISSSPDRPSSSPVLSRHGSQLPLSQTAVLHSEFKTPAKYNPVTDSTPNYLRMGQTELKIACKSYGLRNDMDRTVLVNLLEQIWRKSHTSDPQDPDDYASDDDVEPDEEDECDDAHSFSQSYSSQPNAPPLSSDPVDPFAFQDYEEDPDTARSAELRWDGGGGGSDRHDRTAGEDWLASPTKKRKLTKKSSTNKKKKGGEASEPVDPDEAAADRAALERDMRLFIKSNIELYQRILAYEPLLLEDIYRQLRESCACSKKDLMGFLDEQGIVYVNHAADGGGSRSKKALKGKALKGKAVAGKGKGKKAVSK